MDNNNDGILNVRETVIALGLTCSAEMTQRMKLFYTLHLPPVLPTVEIQSPATKGSTILSNTMSKI